MKMGKTTPDADSLVRCTVCGYEEWVNFATCLRSGWPKCHSYTMRLETHPSTDKIETAVSGLVATVEKQFRNQEDK